jgi:hypothetical protein
MIKLCQLGDLISFGELLKKIDSLENRLADTAACHEGTSVHSVSETETTWNKEEKRVSESEGEAVEGQGWEGLLDYIASKNRAMANVLREWELKSLTSNSIEIVRGKSYFASVYLDDEERLNRLLSYCREFFKRDIKIKVLGERAGNSNDKTAVDDHSNLARPVQEVLEVFEGEIKGKFKGGKHNEGYT